MTMPDYLGFQVPTWAALVRGGYPRAHRGDDAPPMQTRRGLQNGAGATVDKSAFEMLFSDLDPASRVLLSPSRLDLIIPNEEFRVLLLRRFRLALPLTPPEWWCKGKLDFQDRCPSTAARKLFPLCPRKHNHAQFLHQRNECVLLPGFPFSG